MGDRIGSGRIPRGRANVPPGGNHRNQSVRPPNYSARNTALGSVPPQIRMGEPWRSQSANRCFNLNQPNPNFNMVLGNAPNYGNQNHYGNRNNFPAQQAYQPPHQRNPQRWRANNNHDGAGAPNNGGNHYHEGNQGYDNRQQRGPRRDGRKNDRKFHVGFKKLEEWSKEEPDAIIMALVGQKVGFEELLDSSLSDDTVVLVLKVLAKMCLSPFNQNKIEIMNLVSKENFITCLKSFVMQLPLQDRNDRRRNTYFWKDINEFFANVLVVCESMIETIPMTACEILPKTLKSIIISLPNFEQEQKVEVNLDIKAKFEKLQTKLELSKKDIEKKKKEIVRNFYEEAPPDDFRQLTVYPTSAEILTNEQPFVRRHIIKGAYSDVDHYLDVQFRLLKEDFVAPLREGISMYIEQSMSHKRGRISSVKIHSHVEFISPRFGKDQVGVLLQFDFQTTKKKTRVNFNHSRRFMYGSLLCFTRDNFATLLFGKVIERDAKLLENKQIVVGFEAGYDNYDLNQPYIMVECSIYFEPYYHVLKALQNMDEDGFPMRNYLIDVNPNIEPPNYLPRHAVYKIQTYRVPLFIDGSWPTPNELGFDETQHSAFKAALTQKFSVIQGPPGTGKTYLGLEVAKTLIRNKVYWYADEQTPILVVCFTNHALDQFLEGLIGTTTDIVRVGGQSKNKNLEQFNLRMKRKSTSSSRQAATALYNLRTDLASQLGKIKNWSDGLDEIHKCRSVVKFRHFAGLEPEFPDSWFAKASDHAIVEWLLGGQTRRERQQEAQQARVAEMHQEEQENQGGVVDEELDGLLDAQARAQHNIDDDDADLLEMLSAAEKPTYLTSLLQLERDIRNLISDINKLDGEINDQAVFNKKWELERRLLEVQENYGYLQMCLEQGRNVRVLRKPDDVNLRQPHNMAAKDRWGLYFYWLELYRVSLINKLQELQTGYREKYRQYMEIKDIDDTRVMKQMLVVGMTTTGAARLQTTLQALQCRIVIVEEAAEVLESHIIVSLTSHCEHLILIGDHQQLRPSTANYRMEKTFNLGISLFERMVQNNIQCHVLGVQHRMRPEIAKLIVPAIYPVLENHSSVLNFPPVWGVDPCMYFIDHDHPEEEAGDSSKLNVHEAEFLINLARYLIQNGYQPEDITILAAYSGQMFALWRQRKKHEELLQDVRITVLDNYQGEESKIILLSLVRNNNDNKIGFLKIENRVCVALSRAKEGFYMMGNMDLLCRNSEIWPKIKTSIESQGFLGKSLALRCQIHHEEVTRVETPNDFKKVPEGGCGKVCGVEMNCSHKCTRICHILDRVHDTTKCRAACSKILCENDHMCPKMCYEDCGQCQVLMKTTLRCGHEHLVPCFMDAKDYNCETPVRAELPCGHVVENKPCHRKTEEYKCPFPCDTRVEPCGHACRRTCHVGNDPHHLEYKCHKPCAKPQSGCSTGKHMCPNVCFQECPPCEAVVQKIRTVCPHRFNVKCNANVDEMECQKPCSKNLACGHKCKRKCYEPCGNCQVKVDKVLPECNHSVKTKCCEQPSRINCRGECPLLLNCGHPCKEKCNQPCTAKCRELVDHTKDADCGHRFKIECYLRNTELPSNSHKLLKLCREPCTARLECTHSCAGTCGECAQGRIHESCKEKCGVHLICGHECPIPCRDTCQPCNRMCSYRCKHSACKKKCGEPCTKCQEPCARRCRHASCNKKCGDKCTVPPCKEPCTIRLKCGHACVGFCGDPCPPFCRICNHSELTEILFGNEDEEDARFVLLDECKHVIESDGMEQWLQQGGNEINYKCCPKCKTPLSSTQRYNNYIKQALLDIIMVKKKFFGSNKENEEKRTELCRRLATLEEKGLRLKQYSSSLLKVLATLKLALQPVRRDRRQPLSKLLAQTYTSKIQIFENIVDTFNDAKLKEASAIKKVSEYADFLFSFLLRQEHRITNQEIADLQMELKRFTRIVQLMQIRDCAKFLPTISGKPTVRAKYDQINDMLFSSSAYSNALHANLKDKLVDLGEDIEAGLEITDQERQQIVQAMGMKPGHWFKCPNGHFYAIGDCGGAMVVSKCHECGAAIGGTSHTVLPSNQHSGELDGSRHAAWSNTGNNMFNYDEFRN